MEWPTRKEQVCGGVGYTNGILVSQVAVGEVRKFAGSSGNWRWAVTAKRDCAPARRSRAQSRLALPGVMSTIIGVVWVGSSLHRRQQQQTAKEANGAPSVVVSRRGWVPGKRGLLFFVGCPRDKLRGASTSGGSWKISQQCIMADVPQSVP